jgi:hypothetical protein
MRYNWNTDLKMQQGGRVPDFLWDYAQVTPCGSRVTNNPAPEESDWDYLIHILPSCSSYDKEHALVNVCEALHSLGWVHEGSEYYQSKAHTMILDGGFMSWRREEVNLIVVLDDRFAHQHRLATCLCTKLNLPDRDDRVAVFQAVLYGECDVHVSASGSQL